MNSLRFSPGSSLTISNNLSVNSGELMPSVATASSPAAPILAPSGFQKTGLGSLFVTSNLDIHGPIVIEVGALFFNGRFDVPGGLNVARPARLGGAGLIVGNVTNPARQSRQQPGDAFHRR